MDTTSSSRSLLSQIHEHPKSFLVRCVVSKVASGASAPEVLATNAARELGIDCFVAVPTDEKYLKDVQMPDDEPGELTVLKAWATKSVPMIQAYVDDTPPPEVVEKARMATSLLFMHLA